MQWIFFLIGQVVNVFRQASLVASSAPDKNPISKTGRWVYRNLIGLLVREVLAISTWLLLVHPAAGPALIAETWPTYAKYAGMIVSVLNDIPFLAVPFGLFFSIGFDYLLERWTWLKRHIPALGE